MISALSLSSIRVVFSSATFFDADGQQDLSHPKTENGFSVVRIDEVYFLQTTWNRGGARR